MINLSVILIIAFILYLILSFLSLNYKINGMEIIKDMGIGYNLGYLFDCYTNNFTQIISPDDQITLFGNSLPTQELIISIKKYGFKTIRFQITWMHFVDNKGNIDSNWMSRVKEVVNWIINSNLYCIINVHNDILENNWLSEGLSAKDKFINLWSQISNQFKDYDQNLIFESMNEIDYRNNNANNETTLSILHQAFVNTVRNSGNFNLYRLLLISLPNTDVEFTLSSNFELPKDPYNNLGISMHYYFPNQFTTEQDDNPWKEGNLIYMPPRTS